MNLDRIAVEMRSRKGTQSMDLGLLLARRFYWAVLKPWLLLALPLLVLLQWGVYGATGWIWLALLAGWWVKPLFERIPLFVLSQAFFGSTPSVSTTIKTVWKQWLSTDALMDITVRRFSPLRPLTMPVRVLEGGRGASVGPRLSGLYEGMALSQGTGVLSLLLFVKTNFYLAALVLVFLVTNSEFEEDFYIVDFLLDSSGVFLMAIAFAISFVVTTLIEPFVSATGFGIYIQRRIEREGWDLELKFRRLSARVGQSLEKKSFLFVLGFGGLLALFTPLLHHSTAHAEELIVEGEEVREEPLGSDALRRDLIPRNPEEVLDEILEGPAFNEDERVVIRWRKKADESEVNEPFFDPGSTFLELILVFAKVFRVLIWIAFFLFLGWVVYRLVDYLQKRQRPEVSAQKLSRWEEEIFSQGDGELSSIPNDVLSAVRRAWIEGRTRYALALLLLSSLRRFEENQSYTFLDGWTTSRCAREVRTRGLEGKAVAAIALAFDEHAWGQRTIENSRFEALLGAYSTAFLAHRGEDGND